MLNREEIVVDCPCLILALNDAAEAARASRILRCQGWDVYVAHSGPEVRRLARMLEPDHVVLNANLEGESGWLTCKKLKTESLDVKVVLVEPEFGEETAAFAAFVGADAIIRSVFELAHAVPAHRDVASLLVP